MGEQRRTYDAEFKKETLKLLETGDKKGTELAEDLGINVHLLYRWKREEAKAPGRCFSGMGRRMPGTETEEEIRRLRRELDDVRMERDILKKAVAIFSKEPK
jgi:transposase